MTREVTQATCNKRTKSATRGLLKANLDVTHMVRQILNRRSQLHPVIKPAAAGGKMIAT